MKETTVNHFALRHYWWIEVYTCSEHSESVKQYARIVWAFLISSLEVARYDCLHLNVSTSSVQRRKLKKVMFNSCLNQCNFLKPFRFWLLVLCFMIVLWLEINDAFLISFLIFNSTVSAVTACNVGVFKKT